jgi:hypothetical protein
LVVATACAKGQCKSARREVHGHGLTEREAYSHHVVAQCKRLNGAHQTEQEVQSGHPNNLARVGRSCRPFARHKHKHQHSSCLHETLRAVRAVSESLCQSTSKKEPQAPLRRCSSRWKRNQAAAERMSHEHRPKCDCSTARFMDAERVLHIWLGWHGEIKSCSA